MTYHGIRLTIEISTQKSVPRLAMCSLHVKVQVQVRYFHIHVRTH